MMSELQVSALKGASDVVQQVTKDLMNKAIELGLREIGKFSVDFEYTYTKILDRQYRSLYRIKTLANPSVPVAVETIYVAPDIELNSTRVGGQYFVESIKEMKLSVVTAWQALGSLYFLKDYLYNISKKNRVAYPFL